MDIKQIKKTYIEFEDGEAFEKFKASGVDAQQVRSALSENVSYNYAAWLKQS